MDIENEIPAKDNTAETVSQIKAGCLLAIAAIFNRAKRNHRQLIVEETRMLRELTTVYTMFCKIYKPEEKPQENKWVMPEWIRKASGWDEIQAQRSIKQQAQKSIT